MDLQDLTLGQILKIQGLFDGGCSETKNEGFCVVVCDRGFIFIGELIIQGEWVTIKGARNLRKWSSGKGLDWHIENGSENTTIDGTGIDRKLHVSKLQNWAKTDKKKW